jgi:lipopolysaccharide export system ATP-binding protein
LADKDIADNLHGFVKSKKGIMVSNNTKLDFGIARPVLVSGNQGLHAKGVGKSFNKRRVVRNVSLGLQRGEAVGLLGPNGAGKTTTFYMLAGLLPADEGQVFIDGQNVTGMPIFQRARLGMGYLPQESSIFRGLTVEQNIRAVLETLEDHDDERDATLDDLMAEFGITHLRNTLSVNLSGGERRRLEIARALAARPTFLLLDEPLAGIDPIALGEIRDLIAHLKTHGIGVLITDHNVRETLGIVDRAYIIHDGTVLMEGTPDEVVQHSGVRQVYLGERFTI